ncbi:TetR/AcrR family transcriptional regulator [Microbispora bryophytorum]|uniref:TetR/AcrR family transcriptional regulator n=1 Tax=Microbispora bryophytorum TaxID=1460882 RepID=UPI00371D8DAE
MPGRGSGKGPSRRTARGAATRERVIATTADLMHRQGVTATTLDQVVDTCGVSKSQLYHYFPDKEALVAEVIATQANRVLSAQKQLIEQLHTMQELDKWRDALVAGLSENGYRCPIGSLANELAGRCDTARRTLAGAFGTWTGDMAGAFARLQDGGELSSEVAAEDLALEVVAALQGGYLLAQTMQDEQPFVLALDMALGWVKAHARTDHQNRPDRPG